MTPLISTEGLTELTGDVLITCTGGVPQLRRERPSADEHCRFRKHDGDESVDEQLAGCVPP